MFLGVSMDDLSDSDVSAKVNSIEFIAEQDFIDQYGKSFVITLDENQIFSVGPGKDKV